MGILERIMYDDEARRSGLCFRGDCRDTSFTQGHQYYVIVRSTCINKKFRSHSPLQFRTNSVMAELFSMSMGEWATEIIEARWWHRKPRMQITITVNTGRQG